MAYADIGAKSTSDTLTLNNWNGIRNNFLAGVPGIFTTKGDIVIATGSQVATRVGIGADDSTLVADSNQPGGAEWQLQPAARVYNSLEFAMPANASWTDIEFNKERYDTDSVHTNDGTTCSRLSCPASGTGLYFIGGNAVFGASGMPTQTRHGLRISLNSNTPIAQTEQEMSGALGFNDSINISTVYPLTGGVDYVTLQAYHFENGASTSIQVVGNYSPEFYMHWLRRT